MAKSGANFKDRNRIAEMSAAGVKADAIAKKLDLTVQCVENHIKHNKGKKAPKGSSKGEMSEGGLPTLE